MARFCSVPHLRFFNTFNTSLLLLNFHKNICFTWNGGNKMFHVERYKC